MCAPRIFTGEEGADSEDVYILYLILKIIT
jgi:hypothetical protein